MCNILWSPAVLLSFTISSVSPVEQQGLHCLWRVHCPYLPSHWAMSPCQHTNCKVMHKKYSLFHALTYHVFHFMSKIEVLTNHNLIYPRDPCSSYGNKFSKNMKLMKRILINSKILPYQKITCLFMSYYMAICSSGTVPVFWLIKPTYHTIILHA